MHRGRIALALAVGSCLLAVGVRSPTASAELRPLTDGRARLGEGGWAEVSSPPRREGRTLAREGLALLLDARGAPLDDGLGPSSQLQIERAIERLDRAVTLLPDDAELAFLRATALSEFAREQTDGRTSRRTEEALAELERVRTLDPRFEAASVAAAAASLRARLGDYAGADAEYQRARLGIRAPAVPIFIGSRHEDALYSLYAPPSPAILALNQAESVMLSGALSRSRALYEEALAAAPVGSLTRALALFGRALAEERDGAHELALESAVLAAVAWTPSSADLLARDLASRHGAAAPLHAPGVVFEPRWERYAYEALLHEAQARSAQRQGQEDRSSIERARAIQRYRGFFAVGGGASRFASIAQASIARLEAEAAHAR